MTPPPSPSNWSPRLGMACAAGAGPCVAEKGFCGRETPDLPPKPSPSEDPCQIMMNDLMRPRSPIHTFNVVPEIGTAAGTIIGCIGSLSMAASGRLIMTGKFGRLIPNLQNRVRFQVQLWMTNSEKPPALTAVKFMEC
ncbi:hypothetical protein FB45DRAFT_1010100 [Roridomyces roridus]|uniref:Uncharacterized protein n=1 Tax=Roridomyces roridus TaxID=1738132 RepID=A0AAD7B3Q0_9AGAR|nr:hypothetical protein FB45DRAFT_1010100 [Roridomyces roridus]